MKSLLYNVTMDTLNKILGDAVAMAREAGEAQMRLYRSGHLDIVEKQNAFDVVTAADKASERIVVDAINRLYPSHSILSEESGLHEGDSEWLWVIDPLDGTTNYSNGLPLFNVSIGVKHNGETVVGVVYAPALGEMFTAVKGGGALLGGTPIKCGSKTLLEQAVVSTGFPYDKAVNPDNNIAAASRVIPVVRGLRRLGSAALDICYVAAGFLDGYWEMSLNEWDVCAALLIASEAGAQWTDFRHDRNRSVLAASPAIFLQLEVYIIGADNGLKV